jgi:hypothetical protein
VKWLQPVTTALKHRGVYYCVAQDVLQRENLDAKPIENESLEKAKREESARASRQQKQIAEAGIRRDDEKAQGQLEDSVGDAFLSEMSKLKTAREMWIFLEKECKQAANATLFAIHKELTSRKIGEEDLQD